MIDSSTMKTVYDLVKTPFKHGAVIKHEGCLTDSPSVFLHDGSWYMYYACISRDCENSGYETHLASSSDLVNWKEEGVILKRESKSGWDTKQCAGYAAFVDMNFGGSNKIRSVNGKYYITYLGGGADGYEPDPLQMGLAYSKSPIDTDGFVKLEKPVLSPFDADARSFETKTIFKGDMIIDDSETLGYKYINAYNAKPADDRERIYMSVSDDGEVWKRYGSEPLIDETKIYKNLRISGDPQIVKIGDLYVMFYFRFIENRPAYNTFACSYDLTEWTRWEGKPLIEPEYEWENVHAHKSCVIKHKGTVYHYYCAVNKKNERFIALATSKEV